MADEAVVKKARASKKKAKAVESVAPVAVDAVDDVVVAAQPPEEPVSVVVEPPAAPALPEVAPAPQAAPTPAEIRARALEIYRAGGRGTLDNWLQAERELSERR